MQSADRKWNWVWCLLTESKSEGQKTNERGANNIFKVIWGKGWSDDDDMRCWIYGSGGLSNSFRQRNGVFVGGFRKEVWTFDENDFTREFEF